MNSDNPSAVACPECSESSVARSRTAPADNLKMLFWPTRPMRCLQCYQRFWVKEKFTASGKRLLTWCLLALLATSLVIWLLGVGQSKVDAVQTVRQIEVDDTETDTANRLLIDGPIENEQLEPLDQTTTDTTDPAKVAPPLHDVFANRIELENQNLNQDQTVSPSLEKPLSRAQWRRQLEQAKQNSELAETVISERQKKLNDVLEPSVDELKSLAKVEINYEVDQWRNAWANGVVEKYFGFYSDDFVPGAGKSIEQWRDGRRSRVYPGRGIVIELRNFDVSFNAELTGATVDFEQDYRAGSYEEVSQKQLVLVKEGLQWKIVREEQIEP